MSTFQSSFLPAQLLLFSNFHWHHNPEFMTSVCNHRAGGYARGSSALASLQHLKRAEAELWESLCRVGTVGEQADRRLSLSEKPSGISHMRSSRSAENLATHSSAACRVLIIAGFTSTASPPCWGLLDWIWVRTPLLLLPLNEKPGLHLKSSSPNALNFPRMGLMGF